MFWHIWLTQIWCSAMARLWTLIFVRPLWIFAVLSGPDMACEFFSVLLFLVSLWRMCWMWAGYCCTGLTVCSVIGHVRLSQTWFSRSNTGWTRNECVCFKTYFSLRPSQHPQLSDPVPVQSGHMLPLFCGCTNRDGVLMWDILMQGMY